MTDRGPAVDLAPATSTVARVVVAIRDEQLGAPTPCDGTTVAAMLDHLDGLCQAFTAAAAKDQGVLTGSAPSADAGRLAGEWRSRIPQRLDALAAAWRAPSAWEGRTRAGGVDLPGSVAGSVAIDEVVVHGWDLAVATGQSYDCPPELAEAAFGFVAAAVAENPQGSPGLFGPPVPVRDDAPVLDRLLGATGRDPRWCPPS